MNRDVGAHEQGGLPVGVADRDGMLARREGAGVAAGPGEQVVRGQQLVHIAGQLDPGADEHDQVVADPFQVGDQV